MGVGDRLDQHNVVAPTDPQHIEHARAIDEMPDASESSWQAKALDTLGRDGRKTPSSPP
jgi:hypothetical protein